MCYKNGVFDEFIFLTWHINRCKLMLVAQMVVWSLLTAAAVFNKQFN